MKIEEKLCRLNRKTIYCLNDYISNKSDDITLLICENKDIWFNIRRLMFENKIFNICGVQVDGVIYGEGNRICQKNCLKEYTKFLSCKNVHYLYWGDIDREGFNIYLRLCNLSNLDIRLFVQGYQKMLELARGKQVPNSQDNRNIIDDYSSIYSYFNEVEQVELKRYIEENKRLPQEIISYTVLKESKKWS